MSKVAKTLDRILRGSSDANIGFADLCVLLHHLGFNERIRGDHHIFSHESVVEILNLQPRSGKAKVYQVRQVRAVIVSAGLVGEPPIVEETSGEKAERQIPEENDDK